MTALNPNLEFRWLGRIAYRAALDLQDDLVEQRRRGDTGDLVLLLEHEPVYTIGRTRDHSSLDTGLPLPHPVEETNRGGQATWHGPGQLVGYPVLDLKQYGRDLHRYLRALENALINACAECGVAAHTSEGLTGVWVDDRKIASIGVGVRHWVSMHGFAINVCGDLAAFEAIVPCGIENVTMTSVERERDRGESPLTVSAFSRILQPHLAGALAALKG